MQIAVTGATGFLGRYLLRELLAAGHTCRAWYRSARPTDWPPTVDWIAGSLSDPSSMHDLVAGCDAVIHAALDRPGHGFRGSEGPLDAFVERNVVGSLKLIEAARAAQVAPFLFVSTCAVHERILDDRPLDERHPAWPTSHYGAHKAAIEAFVHSYGWGENYAISALRPTGIYGLAQPVATSKWYPLVREVVAGRQVICRRGGKEVHAVDVARAALHLLGAAGVAGECFNCYDRYVSEWEVAHLARELSGSGAEILGSATVPKHEIRTEKLQALGFAFGGHALLVDTVRELVAAAQQDLHS